MKNMLRKDSATAWVLWILFGTLIFCFFCTKSGSSMMFSEYPEMVFFFGGISLLMLGYVLYVAVYASFYKPAPALADEALPGCTVIVPAYNEGEHVAETLYSLLDSDFPAEKMQILAINDGSKDDTYEWICRAAEQADGRITPIDLPRNGGKKHALYQGILQAKFDLIVTVDSDSIVNREGIRNIVSAFSKPDIGGVAGNIRIKNLSDGMLPKMMDVGFMFGFEVIRSAQSILGCVMCTPGALSAYRKSIILPFLDEWLNQTFLGVPAKIGEDRAIATMILQHGFRVVFQSNAVATTCIPYTYSKFCRMLLRWTRSDIRENWIMVKHAMKNISLTDPRRIGLQIHIWIQILNTILPALLLPMFLTALLLSPMGFAFSLYSGMILGFLGALIPAMIYAKRVSVLNSVWALAFSVYGVFALSWICLYSFFTLRNTRWLTRELPEKQGARTLIPSEPSASVKYSAASSKKNAHAEPGLQTVG